MNNYAVDRERWAKLSLLEQMGNIGSDVGRSITAQRAGNRERFEGALCRALDLFDATTDVLIAKKSQRVREVLIAREQYLNLFFGNAPEGDGQKIENYFMQFAAAARRRHFA
jgi:hypothetical protein